MTTESDLPLLYGELASWWPLMSAPADYEEEATIYLELLTRALGEPIASMLELGSGGGNNAVHMRPRLEELVLSDLSPDMLEVSRELNPDCAHHHGDMRSLRLDRAFDAVFVYDAVCYMTTEDDLAAAIDTARMHCRPGGAVLLAPDYVAETFADSCDEGGHDEPLPDAADGALCPRGLRYLEWCWDPDPDDTQYTVDYSYLLRERDGTVRAFHDRHIEGLFPRSTWVGLLEQAGFEVEVVPLEHSEVEPETHEIFVGILRH